MNSCFITKTVVTSKEDIYSNTSRSKRFSGDGKQQINFWKCKQMAHTMQVLQLHGAGQEGGPAPTVPRLQG